MEHIRFVHKKEKDFVCEYCTKAFARKRELPKSVELDLLLHTLYSRLQIQYEKRIQIEEDIIAEILHLKHHLSELDLWKTRYHTQLQRYTGKDIYGKHVLFCERYF